MLVNTRLTDASRPAALIFSTLNPRFLAFGDRRRIDRVGVDPLGDAVRFTGTVPSTIGTFFDLATSSLVLLKEMCGVRVETLEEAPHLRRRVDSLYGIPGLLLVSIEKGGSGHEGDTVESFLFGLVLHEGIIPCFGVFVKP